MSGPDCEKCGEYFLDCYCKKSINFPNGEDLTNKKLHSILSFDRRKPWALALGRIPLLRYCLFFS